MKKLLLLSTSLTACSIFSPLALANPEGGVVSSGAATIQSSANRVDIRQSSDRAVIDWRSFNIERGETTQFHQPSSSSLTVNRINDANPSRILGNLKANGNVVLINQSGISFGKDAVVDVNSLVATTSDITNADAMAGRLHFQQPGSATAAIINEGKITAQEAGLVGLVAPRVENSGVINARLGKVHLASGDRFTVDLYGDGALNITASDAMQDQLVSNSGSIRSDGGVVQITAAQGSQLVNSLVKLDGEIKAPNASEQNGRIIISGNDESMVSITGTLDTSGLKGGHISVTGKNIVQQGKILSNSSSRDGGSVDITFKNAYIDSESSKVEARASGGSGGTVTVKGKAGSRAFVSGQYNVSSSTAKGGTVQITADQGDLKLFGAQVKADGKTGGGKINIGGEYQGGGALARAATTSINFSALLSADATNNGKGGEVIVWSEEETKFGGTVQARGGTAGGDGGLIELSSKDTLIVSEASVTTAAARKSGYKAGQLLLDPKNITIAAGGIPGGISYFEFTDPHPDAGNFGYFNSYKVLPNGNVVITDYLDDMAAVDAGASYLFNGATGGIISMITGSTAGDRIGEGGVQMLTNGNYLILSQSWDNGAMVDVGAITWASAVTGVNGTVDIRNSFVGAYDYQSLQYAIPLTNGNYVVYDYFFNSGGFSSVGGIAWGNGNGGTYGVMSVANSLVGGRNNDMIGINNIIPLANGNYVVISPNWDNVAIPNAGAVTLGNGNGGTVGVVTAANSFVGSRANDRVGTDIWGNRQFVELSNGNFLLGSPAWDNVGAADAGALTWFSGTVARVGALSSANSLVGTTANDRVGMIEVDWNITEIGNDKFAVATPYWTNSAVGAGAAGAVTIGSTVTGISGNLSAANSLVGTSSGDQVGWGTGNGDGLHALGNGNFVVLSSEWGSGGLDHVGAVTWVNGTTGLVGAVNNTNSLVGSAADDMIGSSGIYVLTNGNYVVGSGKWDNGFIVDAGAVTWVNGMTGLAGELDFTNSVVGENTGDSYGSVATLSTGDYLILASLWDNGMDADVGAVTLVDGTTGSTGHIDIARSIIGTTAGDQVGSRGAMEVGTDGLLIFSPEWNNGFITGSGAVTWLQLSGGTHGTVNTANSLYSNTADSYVGDNGGRVLSNGNYLIFSGSWDDGLVRDAGAVTWGHGDTGVFGAIDASNSMVGSQDFDYVGANPDWDVTELANGNYLIMTYTWDNGILIDAGAITWGNGATGTSGVISASNSIVGSHDNDWMGWEDWWDETVLDNGDYIVFNPFWNNGAGAITIIDGTNGSAGELTAANSFFPPSGVGIWPRYGWSGDFEDHVNNRYVIADGTAQKVISIDLNRPRFPDYDSYGDMAGASVTLSPTFITNVLNSGTSVTLQANNDITLDDDLIVSNSFGTGGALTFQAGRSIILNAGIFTDDGDLNLFANEDLSTGVVDMHRDAGNALITMNAGSWIDAGAGTVTIRLDDGTGKTHRGAGDITLRDITAGTIFARNMNATGDIILEDGTLTATNAGTAITLVSRRNFIVNSPAAPLDATIGRWLVYSTNPDDDSIGALGNDFRRFSCTYGGSCPVIPVNGDGLLYSYTPMLDITPDALAAIQYGDLVPSLAGYAYSVSGYLDSDENDDTLGGSLNGSTSYTVGSGVNTYNINYSNGTLTSAMGYGFNYLNNAAGITVDKKDITASFNAALTKVYGDANPAIAYGNFTFTGLVGADSASLFTSITPDFGGVDANTDVSVGNAVTATIGSTANYNVTNTPATTLSITPRALTVTTNGASKVLPAGDPVFTGSHNLTAFDAAQISWTYAPIGYLGLDGTYTIGATANDPAGRLANYTRVDAYGNFVVHPAGTVLTPPPAPNAGIPDTVTYVTLGGYMSDLQGESLQPRTGDAASAAGGMADIESELVSTEDDGEPVITTQDKSFIKLHPRLKSFLTNPFAMLMN